MEALGLWQNGWGEDQQRRLKLAAALVQEAAPLAEMFRSAGAVCYRKRFLNLEDLKNLLRYGSLADGVSSWSSDLATAEHFKLETRPNAISSAVFAHCPLNNQVVLNIAALWSDPQFRTAAEDYLKRGLPGATALFNFRDKQREVVLDAPLNREELIALTGVTHIDFDKACKAAGLPRDRADQGWSRLVDKDLYPEGKGVSIIRGEAAKRALLRVETALRTMDQL